MWVAASNPLLCNPLKIWNLKNEKAALIKAALKLKGE
jgi:hypothetical protein